MKNKKIVWVLTMVISVALLVAACGGEKEYEPREVNEEVDICVICNMSVKDDEYATQIVTKDGQSLMFDDIGDMHKWLVLYGSDNVGAEFVKDFNTNSWIKYETSYYAYDPEFPTPMAFGVLSFVNETEANDYVKEQGKGIVMSAADLADHSWEVNRDMMGSHGDGHSHEDGEEHGEEHAHEDEDTGHQTSEESKS